MQTHADLLQAHLFQARRAVAALVTGRPNVAEPPMRRLTLITVAGIVIAILVAVGFAVLGVRRPTADASRNAHGPSAVQIRLCAYPQGCAEVRPALIRYAPSGATAGGGDVAQYTVDQDAMAQGAATVGGGAAQIQDLLGRLRAEVDTMMGGWRGEAASAFMRVHAAFEEQADRITDALRQMHEALLATHRTYGMQESAQARTLSGLAGQING